MKSVVFSPDGKQVVSGGDDNRICIWDARGKGLISRIGSHTSPVNAVAFSRDGRHLVSGEGDKSLRIYTRHRKLWGRQWD